MEIILLFIRIFLAAIFALAGIGKLLDLEGSKKAVKDFGAPEELAKPLAIALPFAEIIFAVSLLFVETSWIGAIGALILLLTFIGGMIWQMAQGNAPDCHCFGAIHSEPVSKKSLVRNIGFAVLALFLIAQGRENQGLSLTAIDNEMIMQLILGLAVIGFLTAIVFYLKKISEQQLQIMRRIEVLEVISHEGGKPVERDDVSSVDDDLPIGAPMPKFTLPDINGKNVSLENLLAKSKPILFFFVSPGCSPCGSLVPEFESWQEELKDKINFVFISSGKAKENLEKFAGKSLKQILLQKDKEVSELLGANWTPTALLVSSEGKVASHNAVGDTAIRELVEQILEESSENEFLFIPKSNGSPIKIGETIPEFSLPDASGNQIGKKDFQGKKTLITFWSTTCPHCVNLLEDLTAWDKSKGQDEPDLMFFSNEDFEVEDALHPNSRILIDKDHEISGKLGMHGTPSAVLVNEEGKIVSETAIGSTNIWALLGKRKKI